MGRWFGLGLVVLLAAVVVGCGASGTDRPDEMELRNFWERLESEDLVTLVRWELEEGETGLRELVEKAESGQPLTQFEENFIAELREGFLPNAFISVETFETDALVCQIPRPFVLAEPGDFEIRVVIDPKNFEDLDGRPCLREGLDE